VWCYICDAGGGLLFPTLQAWILWCKREGTLVGRALAVNPAGPAKTEWVWLLICSLASFALCVFVGQSTKTLIPIISLIVYVVAVIVLLQALISDSMDRLLNP
jgi:CHASE2 domain-containing sensor protein